MSKVLLLFLSVFLLVASSFGSNEQLRFGSQRVSVNDVTTLPPAVDARPPESPLAPPDVADSRKSGPEMTSVMARPPLTIAQRQQISQLCRSNQLSDDQCKKHWVPLLTQSLQWLAIQHEGNWGMEYWMKYETFRVPYWQGYKKALASWRWTRWNDDNPFLDDYVGHPMMGAITSAIYIQNDPRSATLEFGRSKDYWKSRLGGAFWFSTIYSTQWKLGPASEASLEKVGSFMYYDAQFNKTTNGTGMVSFVTTPVGGTMWLIAEDILDKYAMRRLENVSRNPLWLTALAFVEPCRSAANVLRFKAPWYRDNRRVKAFEKRERLVARE